MASYIKGLDKDKELFISKLSTQAKENNYIDPALYAKYEVKRGLRDISGKGVLAGLTEVGEVHAYVLDENELIPVPGRLIYRGIDIYDLTKGFLEENRFGFEEVAYLLLSGQLPSEEILKEFKAFLEDSQAMDDVFLRNTILEIPSKDIMNTLARGVLTLYNYDNNPDDISIENVIRQSLELIAKLPLIAVYGYQAYVHKYLNQSLVLHSPKAGLSIAENILHMLRPDSKYSELEAVILDLLLVLHAEHGGGNNSTFTTHVVTSTGTDTYSAIAAAIASLKGPRHGGANIKVRQMFNVMKEELKDWEDEDEIRHYLLKILRKEAFDRSGLIYGIGHAVYSISDPRSVILKGYAEQLAKEKGYDEEYQLYERVERLAPEVISKERKMYKGVCANVDYYSGLVYNMLGIPGELFTPLFAVSRVVGWCAHRIEELVNPGKVVRPAFKSVAERKEYIPLKNR
ncbi:MAG TPA: citrate/2-methylcitrate synthase [Defluviitaleaceae bacterium]|jgi:citrate synthase|nr:citrate/2-methylcitrate synthase [Candidatus Epulonipiscium sp.]HOQ17829.1 citrate/2-methylcitrate synthase [Defluviitaleaceae bacterium]HPT76841.1 citrate/2-methylcitrate synthase [Defluviitaleaceae bacterium]HQD50739.1 citrate/2-methylcitrate synthase [Defluviitaleaceae bacterium]